MKLVVCTVCFNEIGIMPFWLRHYEQLADKMIVYDDHSDDGTAELLAAHPKVDLRPWTYESHLDDCAFLDIARHTNGQLKDSDYDWVIWVDADEFVYGEFLKLSRIDADIITCRGYNMVGQNIPMDDGKSQIWELHRHGVESSVYGKPIIYRRGLNPPWGWGKHALYGDLQNARVRGPDRDFALLHYRYMGFADTEARNRRNYGRAHEKTFAWSNKDDYTGEHSPLWADMVIKDGVDVVSQYRHETLVDSRYVPTPEDEERMSQ